MLVSWPAIRNATDGERVHIYSHSLDARGTVLWSLVRALFLAPHSMHHHVFCFLRAGEERMKELESSGRMLNLLDQHAMTSFHLFNFFFFELRI